MTTSHAEADGEQQAEQGDANGADGKLHVLELVPGRYDGNGEGKDDDLGDAGRHGGAQVGLPGWVLGVHE